MFAQDLHSWLCRKGRGIHGRSSPIPSQRPFPPLVGPGRGEPGFSTGRDTGDRACGPKVSGGTGPGGREGWPQCTPPLPLH